MVGGGPCLGDLQELVYTLEQETLKIFTLVCVQLKGSPLIRNRKGFDPFGALVNYGKNVYLFPEMVDIGNGQVVKVAKVF